MYYLAYRDYCGVIGGFGVKDSKESMEEHESNDLNPSQCGFSLKTSLMVDCLVSRSRLQNSEA